MQRTFIAQHAGRCASCGGDIWTGERIKFTRDAQGGRKKTAHEDCREHKHSADKVPPHIAEAITDELAAALL